MKANETTSGIGMIEGSAYRNKFFSVEYTLPRGTASTTPISSPQ